MHDVENNSVKTQVLFVTDMQNLHSRAVGTWWLNFSELIFAAVADDTSCALFITCCFLYYLLFLLLFSVISHISQDTVISIFTLSFALQTIALLYLLSIDHFHLWFSRFFLFFFKCLFLCSFVEFNLYILNSAWWNVLTSFWCLHPNLSCRIF